MVCGTFKINKVPASDVKMTEDLFRANKPPPNSVKSVKDPDGTFTVTAEFPPCPDNTKHSPS